MKSYYIGLILVIILSCFSCSRTCENVKVGETDLSDETRAFFKYSDQEQVSFSTEDGGIISFQVSILESKHFICQEVTCDPLDPYKSSFCEYIEAPNYGIFLNSDSTLIAIEASVFAYEPETDLLYDAIRFTLSHVNASALASHVTDIKFDSPSFDKNNISDIDAFMVERDEVELRNKIYKNVLVCEDQDVALYITKEEGVVGFRIGEKTFTKNF